MSNIMNEFESNFFHIPVEDGAVSLAKYANALTECYEKLDEQGYDVINVVPVNNINSAMNLTTGAVLIGKLKSYSVKHENSNYDNLSSGKSSIAQK